MENSPEPRKSKVPPITLLPGAVNGERERVELWAKKGKVLVARLAPADEEAPEAGAFVIEWAPGAAARKWREQAERMLDNLLISKYEERPWSYLCYHCGTTSNGYAWDGGGVYFAFQDNGKSGRGDEQK